MAICQPTISCVYDIKVSFALIRAHDECATFYIVVVLPLRAQFHGCFTTRQVFQHVEEGQFITDKQRDFIQTESPIVAAGPHPIMVLMRGMVFTFHNHQYHHHT